MHFSSSVDSFRILIPSALFLFLGVMFWNGRILIIELYYFFKKSLDLCVCICPRFILSAELLSLVFLRRLLSPNCFANACHQLHIALKMASLTLFSVSSPHDGCFFFFLNSSYLYHNGTKRYF